MKLNIPRKVEVLKLADYSTGFGDAVFHVWVNPPRRLLINHDDILSRVKAATNGLILLQSELMRLEAEKEKDKEKAKSIDEQISVIQKRKEEGVERVSRINEEMITWLSEIWSQGPEETRMSIEETSEFLKTSLEEDPAFNEWITSKTIQLIQDHTRAIKKDCAPRS